MLSKSHYVDIKCPQCEAWMKFEVGVEHDGDESGVWSYIAANLEKQTCKCELTDEEIEEAGNIAKDEYEAPEYPAYPV